MKKIISMLTLVATMVTMCSFSAFAYDSTLTMSTDATDSKANTGDEVIVTVKVGTTQGMKALGFKVVFDPNDFEFGMSQDAKDLVAEYTPDTGFATFDEYCVDALGCASYVDTTYFYDYSDLRTNAKLGDPTIGPEDKNGKTYVTFGYGKGTAISATNAKTDFAMGGLVLKVKTSDKKQANITIEEATAAGSDGVDTPCTISNTITLNLNGYGEGPVEDKTVTAEEDANGVTTIKYGKDYTGSKALEGKQIVVKTLADTDNITIETRFNVTFGDETKPYGGTLWDQLGLEGKGALAVNKLTIAIAFDAGVENVTAANVSVALVK